MDFVEMQQFIEKDEIITSCLYENLDFKRNRGKPGSMLEITTQEIAIKESGILGETIKNKAYTILPHQEIIINSYESVYLEYLTEGEVLIYSKKEVFDLLESKNILQHFFYLILEKVQNKINYLETISNLKGMNKILYFFKRNNLIAEKERKYVVFPEWLTIARLSRCCLLSAYTTSKLINQLKREDRILVKKHNSQVI